MDFGIETTGSGRLLRRSLLSTASVVGILLFPSTSFAQASENEAAQTTAGSAEATTGEEQDTIVVTGSRVRSQFTAPSPMQVLGSEDIEARGATNITTMLHESPVVSATRSSIASNGVRTQTPGQQFVDLRGLGTPRTLVLVNGRRFVPTMPSASVGNPYQVDLNLIPSLMVERVEIVTGGASAQWGSDAVAGVVNMMLKNDVQGVQGEVSAGISQRGDGFEGRVGLIAGTSFHDDRGNVVLSGDYVKSDGIELATDRNWADDYCFFFNNPESSLATGLPAQVLACDTQAGNRTPGGLIVSATGGTTDQRAGLVGREFTSATTVRPFQRGLYNPFRQTVSGSTTSQTFAATQSGGAYPEQEQISLLIALERKVTYGHFDYDLTDNLNVFIEGSWGQSTGFQNSRPARDQGGVFNPTTGTGTQVRIYADNPYIPDVLRGSIPAPAGPPGATAPSGQSFVMSRNSYDLPQPNTELSDTAWTITGGFEGSLGGGWDWNASYIHGQNDYHRVTYNARDRVRYAQSVDAVRDPASGRVVCRSTLTNPGNGCVPVNLFGSGSPTSEATDWFLFDAEALLRYKQDAAQLNFTGSPFSTWAGEVATAVGLEWRHESARSTIDSQSRLGVWESSVGSEFTGSFTVKEGYLEATVPLARDMSMLQSLAVNGAIRYAVYSGDASAADDQTTWKVGATWEPVNDLLLRITHSLDIRAPNLYELNVPPVFSQQNFSFNGRQYTGVRIANSGNSNLVPEKSKTLTFGGSWSPSFVPRLRMSLDYYDIKVEDVINTLGPLDIIRNCEAAVPGYCDQLIIDPATGNLLQVNDQFLNLASYDTSGIDFTVAYSMPMGRGDLSFTGAATYVNNFTITTPSTPPVVIETAGMNGTINPFSMPHFKANARVTYSEDAFSLSLQARYVGDGRIDNDLSEVATATAPPDIAARDNHVPAYVVFNLSGTVDILSNDRLELFWNIDNIFDEDPLLVPNLSSGLQTNGALYDVMGRYFRLGARFAF